MTSLLWLITIPLALDPHFHLSMGAFVGPIRNKSKKCGWGRRISPCQPHFPLETLWFIVTVTCSHWAVVKLFQCYHLYFLLLFEVFKWIQLLSPLQSSKRCRQTQWRMCLRKPVSQAPLWLLFHVTGHALKPQVSSIFTSFLEGLKKFYITKVNQIYFN